MRIKKFTLLMLTLMMMSVVAFAQKPDATSKRLLAPFAQNQARLAKLPLFFAFLFGFIFFFHNFAPLKNIY